MALQSVSGRTQSADTKTRILDATEDLFVEFGYESMSLRQITSAAQVNLASVNYHFGGKEALIQAVLSRRMDKLNDERLKLLDALQSTQGAALTCEHVLVAMFLPALRMAGFDEAGGPRFLRFLGRAYTDVSSVVQDFVNGHYTSSLGRFFDAFQQTLPQLPRQELGFRLHFAMGAVAGVLASSNTNRLVHDFTRGQSDDEAVVIGRLAALMVAALNAPLPDPAQLDALKTIIARADESRAAESSR
ncbi:TetR/AcrR family transcriptional regulator [Aquabacterium sp.]|uniref:TetR/AcrR family transcriptional regulator n=1 Tax=Aquabacterium sp. TaxID=1872578 RepID=UPI0035B39EF4